MRCVCVCVHVYMCTCVCVYVYVCVCVCVCVCLRMSQTMHILHTFAAPSERTGQVQNSWRILSNLQCRHNWQPALISILHTHRKRGAVPQRRQLGNVAPKQKGSIQTLIEGGGGEPDHQ